MNIGKRFMAMALAGLMLVSGCKKNEVKKDSVNDAVQDLGGEVVIKVGDTEMTDNQFHFFVDNIKMQMQGTELSSDEEWEKAEIDGRKAIDVAKERAYEEVVDYLSMIEVGKKEGITCTKEEIDSCKEMLNADLFEEYAEKDSIINLICELNVYTGKLQQKFLEENTLDDAEIEAYYNENKAVLSDTYLRAKHVLILTQDEATRQPLPEAEIAQRKIKADEVLKRAKSGEDFDTLVQTLSEDPGSHSQPDGYVFVSGEMVPEFENCVRSLGMNEIGFAETSYGYHIIKRLELDLSINDCKEAVKSEMYSGKFEEYIDKKIADYKIEITKNDEVYDLIK